MLKSSKHTTSSPSFNQWKEEANLPRVMLGSSTQYKTSEQVVNLQGQYVTSLNGDMQLIVTIDPANIERKLAIRELNAHLEGRILKSQTFISTI